MHIPKNKFNKAFLICEKSNVGNSVNEAKINAFLS
jgi:hypothetical protein